MSAFANPYNPLQPSGDPRVFFGQEQVFAFFRQHLVGSPLARPLVLIGRRGLGKSAVLQQLVYQLEERYRPCIVAVNAIEPLSEPALTAAIAGAVLEALEAAEASTYRLPEWPQPPADQPPDPRAWLREEFVPLALSALRMRHLLIAFDDAHLLIDAQQQGALPADWLDFLGALLAQFERLDAVLALDAAYEDRALSIPLLNDPVLHHRLAELAPEDAERLIHVPTADVYSYAPGVAEGILALAGGHPFLLQAICFLLFRRSEERMHAGPITAHDLESIQPAVLDQADVIYAPLWESATANERMVLTALVRLAEIDLGDEELPDVAIPFAAIHGWLTGAGHALTRAQLAAALRSLEYAGLIRASGDGYELPARLIAEWVKANVGTPAAPDTGSPQTRSARLARLGGLVTVLLIVAILGAAALSGVFEGDEDQATARTEAPTATLAVDLEGTRQGDFATQTEAARPTETPTATRTRRPSATPTATATPSASPSATATATASSTATASPTVTASPTATRTPTATASPTPQISPTLTASATLDPGR